MKLRSGEDIGININDILDELREENKRLFNELLFATKCVNQLKRHLIEIHSKYDLMIGFEDKQHFNELRDQLNGICVQNDVKSDQTIDTCFDGSQRVSEEMNDKYFEQKVTKINNNNEKQLKSSLNCRKQQKNKTFSGCHSKTTRGSLQCQNTSHPNSSQTKSVSEDKNHERNDEKQLDAIHGVCEVIVSNNRLISDETMKAIRNSYDPSLQAYKCPFSDCKKCFKSDYNLTAHYRHVHINRVFGCDFVGCGKVYKQKSTLTEHKRSAHLNQERRNTKPRPKRTVPKETLDLINNSYDASVGTFRCPDSECVKCCESVAKLVIHFKINHMRVDDSLKQYKCDYSGCDKRFLEKSGLREHSLSIHSSEPAFLCPIEGCGQAFVTRHYLDEHKIQFHNYPKRVHRRLVYTCDWPECGYKADKNAMTSHKRRHTGERPFACDWPDCDKRFRIKKTLIEHRNKHLNLKPHECHWPGCHYKTSFSGNISIHIKQHKL